MGCGDKIILEANSPNSPLYTVISKKHHVPNKEEHKNPQLRLPHTHCIMCMPVHIHTSAHTHIHVHIKIIINKMNSN